MLALDGKMNFDDNALYRHKDIEAMRDFDEEDSREIEASKRRLVVRFRLRIQPIDATDCRYRSAGVSYFSVFLGRSFNFLATAFSLACE